MPYELSTKSRVYDRAHQLVLPLDKLVREHYRGAEGIWKYQPFETAGVVPKTLVPTKKRSFMSDAEGCILRQVVGAVHTSKQLDVIYAFKYDQINKLLQPTGVKLVTKGQVILKPGSNVLE